jgi:hypothetical protein
MSRVGLVRLAVAVFLAVSARPGVAQQPPQLGDYSVLALEDVLLKAGARLVSGAAGAVDGTVTLKRGARVAGTIVAGTLELARDSRVGRTFCGIVIGRPPLPACNLPPSPVVDPALLPPVSVVPGVNDLEVPSRTGIAPVGPGSFDEVIVGRGALLNLSGGDYTARSIRVAADGQLLCSEACRIGVAESIRLGPRAELGARGGLSPQNVRIDVAGSGSQPPAFRGKPRSSVTGTIYAPAGVVRLGRLGSYRGAFVGTEVIVGPEAQVRLGSAL